MRRRSRRVICRSLGSRQALAHALSRNGFRRSQCRWHSAVDVDGSIPTPVRSTRTSSGRVSTCTEAGTPSTRSSRRTRTPPFSTSTRAHPFCAKGVVPPTVPVRRFEYADDDGVTAVAVAAVAPGIKRAPLVCERYPVLDGDNIATRVFHSGRPARLEGVEFQNALGVIAEGLRRAGLRRCGWQRRRCRQACRLSESSWGTSCPD
jgi:hypothetical protein